MALSFQGKIVAITGGGSGIGAACARFLATQGAVVAILDRNMGAAKAVAKETGGLAIEMDVRDEKSTLDAVQTVESELGPIAGAITSAGIVQRPDAPEQLSMADYDQIYAVNQRGTYLSLCALATPMIARGQGSLVAVSSVTARCGTPLHAYGPTKAAVTSLVRGLAGEWGRSGIRINAIEPGYTRTPALQAQIDAGQRDVTLLSDNTALGRMIEPEEVASVATFLLSDAASAVTGVSMPVDAGFLIAGSWAPYGGVRAART